MKLGYFSIAIAVECVSIMAETVGLAQFSGAWWAFVFAAVTLAVVFSQLTASPATP